jgi:hypothetical protein
MRQPRELRYTDIPFISGFIALVFAIATQSFNDPEIVLIEKKYLTFYTFILFQIILTLIKYCSSEKLVNQISDSPANPLTIDPVMNTPIIEPVTNIPTGSYEKENNQEQLKVVL